MRREPSGENAQAEPDAGVATVPLPSAARTGQVSHAIFRVARLHRMLAGQLLRRAGLHPGQELVMMHLWEQGPQRQTDLVRLLDSDAATMTRTIRRLEHAGFVRRRPCPTDKRAALIEVTPAGHALQAVVESIWAELEQHTTAGLALEERETVLRMLGQLEGNLTRTPPPQTESDASL
ncbi:MarR family winged helix-turn-helix transcriptional regulator [Streptomyces sp. NPDC029006]|uniref:MarR family winged helix-turn-helix transcriptional regulator n=1 Tax=Streptomyces sp. NPDC029006 TaxID=3155467 RepID=UPI0033F81C68